MRGCGVLDAKATSFSCQFPKTPGALSNKSGAPRETAGYEAESGGTPGGEGISLPYFKPYGKDVVHMRLISCAYNVALRDACGHSRSRSSSSYRRRASGSDQSLGEL